MRKCQEGPAETQSLISGFSDPWRQMAGVFVSLLLCNQFGLFP